MTAPTDLAWFVDARLGMFVHWGLYSLAARHEWVKSRERMGDADYESYREHFDPDRFDPRAWARTAREAEPATSCSPRSTTTASASGTRPSPTIRR